MNLPRLPAFQLRTMVSLIGCLLPAACHPTGTDRVVLDAWLTCVECTDGELDSVKVLAARLPETVDTLRLALLRGLPADAQVYVTRQLFATYQRMAEWSANQRDADSLLFSQVEYIQRYRDKLEGIYQSRAARALSEIGGRRALHALDEALRLPADSYPTGVRARIQFARDSLVGH